MQKDFEELKNEFESIQEKYTLAQKEIQQLKDKLSSSNQTIINNHSSEFWIDIKDKINNKDHEYIKHLVKSKKLSLHDVNNTNATLLIIAAENGSYEMVQFCLNSGADINHKNYDGDNALKRAIDNGYYHIQQLLVFSELNVNVGNKVKNTANIINTQKGINHNMNQELNSIGKQTKTIFEQTMMELMINLINNKLSFDDTLLNFCWNMLDDPLSSDLWKTMSSTCRYIIEYGDKRDWYWFRTFLLPSTIWFRTIDAKISIQMWLSEKDTNIPRYLYFELLKLVQHKGKLELETLQNNLSKLTKKHKNDWIKLIDWDISSEYTVTRQDSIPNGIEAQYKYPQLLEKSGAHFNAHQFYDRYHYLPELVLLAQMIDDDFQTSVQRIFNVDRETRIGCINDDEKNPDGLIKYIRGPVKLLERAKFKAENDYSDQPFPQSACILDLNRCALVFNDIHTLLCALQLFVNKIRYFQSGSIIGIVRNKNGFKEYVKETQYADIKLNVLIKGKMNNIIGEIQLLLQPMKDYKDTAHNLYSIEREREYIENSVSHILPMLLDTEQQLFVAGNMNDVKALCRLMSVNNFTKKDLIKKNKKDQTILLHACEQGNDKVFLFLKSIINEDLFIEYLFSPAIYDDKPIEMALSHNNAFVVRSVLKMKKVQKKYNADDDELFRLLFNLFAINTNHDVIDYVVSALNLSKHKIYKMMHHKYTKPSNALRSDAWKYHRYKIITGITHRNKLDILKKVVFIIGEKSFIDCVFIVDDWNINAIEYAVIAKKMKIVQYILSFNKIRSAYLKDDHLLFRLLFSLFTQCSHDGIVDYVLSTLNISSQKLATFIPYEYPVSSTKFGRGSWSYHRYQLIPDITNRSTLDKLKKLVSIMGEKAFIDGVCIVNDWNMNAIEYAVKGNTIETIEYILSFEEIKKRYLADNNLLFRLISTLFGEHTKKDTIEFVFSILNISQKTLATLMLYQYPAPLKKFGYGACVYDKVSIIAHTVYFHKLDILKTLVSMIGETAFASGAFHKDGYGAFAILYAIQKNKLNVMKYMMQRNEIKQKCIDDKAVFLQIVATLSKCYNEAMAMCIINALDLTKNKLKGLHIYKQFDITKILNLCE